MFINEQAERSLAPTQTASKTVLYARTLESGQIALEAHVDHVEIEASLRSFIPKYHYFALLSQGILYLSF